MRLFTGVLARVGLAVVISGLASAQARGTDGLDKSLEHHPFFSKVSYERVDLGPFLFLVQKPARDDPAYAARVAGEYLALMQPVEAAFEARYVVPFELERRTPRHVVAILASEGDFETYLDVTEAGWHVDVRSTLDPVFGGAVVHEAPFQTTRDDAERERSARHAMAHLMQNATYGGSRGAPVLTWAFEGVAAYLAGLAPDGASTGADRQAVRELVAACGNPNLRWANLRTLEELATISDGRRLTSWLRVEARRRKLPELDSAETMQARASFYRQAALLMTYLQEGDQQVHAPAFETFWRASLAGESDMAALAEAFPHDVLARIDTDFLQWLAREHQRAWPQIAFDAQVLLDAGPAAGAGSDTTTSAEAVAEVVSAGLVFEDATPLERLALAVWEARSGRTSVGLAALESMLARGEAGELADRVQLERDRMAAWIQLRDAFLEKCLAEQLQFQFEYRGKRSQTRIESLADGSIVLQPNRLGVSRLEVEALAPTELARQMAGSIDELAEDWVRVYPYVLEEDAKWKRFLRGDDEGSEALRADAEESYPELLRIARAAEFLISIQELPDLRGPAEAEAELEALRTLCTDFGDVDLVARRYAALRGRAEQVAGSYFDLVRPWQALEGQLEELGDERVALTYDFSSPEQRLDFQAHPYLTTHGRKFGELKTAEEPGLRIEDGMLRGIGNACLRSLVDLATPLKVTYEFGFENVPGLELPIWYLNVGICDDGLEHFAWAMNVDYLEVWERDQVDSAYPSENTALYMDEFYTVELKNDGKLVVLSCEGDEKQELPSRSRQGGATFLWAYTDFPVHVKSLRIEGRTTAASFERLKRAWVSRQLEW